MLDDVGKGRQLLVVGPVPDRMEIMEEALHREPFCARMDMGRRQRARHVVLLGDSISAIILLLQSHLRLLRQGALRIQRDLFLLFVLVDFPIVARLVATRSLTK